MPRVKSARDRGSSEFAAATTSGGNWLQVSPHRGATKGTLTITAKPADRTTVRIEVEYQGNPTRLLPSSR